MEKTRLQSQEENHTTCEVIAENYHKLKEKSKRRQKKKN